MTSPATEIDPFSGSESAPALSFKDKPVGTRRRIVATGPANLVQSRDYESGDLAFWPDGNKKMSAVFNGVDEQGDPISVWAAKPSSLFTAIAEAQKTAGHRIDDGTIVDILFESEKPNAKNPRLNAQKIYKAKVTPGAPTTPPPPSDDPWGSNSPAAGGDEPPW